MSATNLAPYLNDHLSGSVAAIELLEHLERSHAGTPVATFAAELRHEIEPERLVLVSIIQRLKVGEGPVRKAAAWVSEKFVEAKLKLEDIRGDRLRLLEAFEALSLGIEGRRLLWRALAAGAESIPELRGHEYSRFDSVAENQRRRVEVFRLNALRETIEPEVEAG